MIVACTKVSLKVERWLHSFDSEHGASGICLGLEVRYELNREIKMLDLNPWENGTTMYRDGERNRRNRFWVKSRVLICAG